jgi:signal peptide peptidase SppA
MMNAKSAAADVLSMSGLCAWEPEHRTRALGLVQQFHAGQIDRAGLRAGLGASGRDVGASVTAGAKGVAVIPLMGVLSPTASLFSFLGVGTSLQAFGQQLKAAAADASIKGIVVLCDSPGGFVGLVPETAALVRQIRGHKPIVCVVSGLNASAAYWITSNATSIEATPSALVGAIGVFTIRASFARQLQTEGVDVEVISAGKFKAEGIAALPMTEGERASTQAHVDETYDGFAADVADGRGVPVSAVRSGFGEGRVVSAKRALALGMIDRVAVIEDSFGRALAMTGLRAQVASDDDRQRRLRLGLPATRAGGAGDNDLRLRRLRIE